MRNIRVLCIGKKQEPYLKTGIEIFQKKLNRYCHFELVLLKEADYAKGSIQQWQLKEQQEIESRLQSQSYVIACDETGKGLSSSQLAGQFEMVANQGCSKIEFIIGGPYGLSGEISKRADLVLSLSCMTLTHQMARLILIEQIYRAFTIINGEKYHH